VLAADANEAEQTMTFGRVRKADGFASALIITRRSGE
jgi:hypothetical protein